MPLVSAIVPFYGVEDYLAACLDSILAQTLPDFECILVDDGSPDGSAAIAQQYAERDPRVRVLTQANAGLGPARNAGTAAASGRYLTFLDSDDLLAPRAFEQQVTSLERSGSDFAGSNVWRWSLVRGVELSWAHQEPFARRLERTTIAQVPLLMRDRMVWNKMWRRSFWDEFGYEFPALQFEDFPVTLRAHLQARAVDTLPEPSYVWRERPSGQSISSQGRQLVNVRDRVTAALMVLDSVDELGTGEVRELVHSHLVDVDLREVTGSLAQAPDEAREPIMDLAHELAQRIDPAMVSLASPLRQRGYRAARRGDTGALLAVAAEAPPSPAVAAALRSSGSSATGTPVEAAKAALLTARGKAAAATHKASALASARTRNAEVIDARRDELHFVFRVQIALRDELAKHAKLTVHLGQSPLDVQTKVLAGRIVADITIPTLMLLDTATYQSLRIELRAGPLHWSGGVRAETEFTEGVARGGYWLQPTIRAGLLGLQRHRSCVTLRDADAETATGGATVRLGCSAAAGSLTIDQPWPADPIEIPVTDHTAIVDLAAIAQADPPDQPVARVASRGIEYAGTPVRWLGAPVTVVAGSRQVEVRRGDDGRAFLVHRPAPEQVPA